MANQSQDNGLNSRHNGGRADGGDRRVFYVALDETIVERASELGGTIDDRRGAAGAGGRGRRRRSGCREERGGAPGGLGVLGVDNDKVESRSPGSGFNDVLGHSRRGSPPPPPRRCESHASCIAHPPDPLCPPPPPERRDGPAPARGTETERERAKERTRRGGVGIRSADTIILNFVRSVTPSPC